MEITGTSFSFAWEEELIILIQSAMGNIGTVIASLFSAVGEELLCVAVLGLFYWGVDKKFGRIIGINILVGTTVNSMIKNVFVRRRPYFDNPAIKCLKPSKSSADIYDLAAQGYSFPSGHSTNSVVVFGSVALWYKKRWISAAAVILALLCGISRFCLGVHYPTDVLAGWITGSLVIFIIPFLYGHMKRPAFYAVLTAVAVSGIFWCRSDDYFSGLGLLTGFLIACEFEERFVKFDNTGSPVRCIIRVIGGIAVFTAVSGLLKLPFDDDFLSSGTAAAHLVRSMRYMITSFVDIAVYPIVFRVGDRIFKKRKQ